MPIQGIGQGITVHVLQSSQRPAQNSPPAPAETSSGEAATSEISDEARSLSQRSGKASPRGAAEALGAKNFGQALKALRDAGVELSGGFVSDLVHGDETALATAQAALAPPPTEPEVAEVPVEGTAEPVLTNSEPTGEPAPLQLDVSGTSLNPPAPPSGEPVDDTTLLESLLLDETLDPEVQKESETAA